MCACMPAQPAAQHAFRCHGAPVLTARQHPTNTPHSSNREDHVTPDHLYVCRSVPVAVSHSRSLPSSQHDSSRSSRGLHATYSTAAPCPASLCRSVQRPVLGQTCHKMTQRSCTVTTKKPSRTAGVEHVRTQGVKPHVRLTQHCCCCRRKERVGWVHALRRHRSTHQARGLTSCCASACSQ
jgi:hypothetical protein